LDFSRRSRNFLSRADVDMAVGTSFKSVMA
jgi:hypothetical protein